MVILITEQFGFRTSLLIPQNGIIKHFALDVEVNAESVSIRKPQWRRIWPILPYLVPDEFPNILDG